MAGLIPQIFLDDLLLKTELVELIDSYVPLKKSGHNYVACCPFHNEKSPSFNVVAKKQFYHCFGCGASGNAISFVMNYQNANFTEAVEMLASRVGLTVIREGKEGQKEKKNSDSLYDLLEQVNLYYQKQLKYQGQEAVLYLQNRGLDGTIAKEYQLGFAQDGWHNLEQSFATRQKELLATGMLIQNEQNKIYDRYRNRIMFPIHDRHGRIIGFGGRVLSKEQKPKYLNSPETVIFQKNRELYGLHQILKKRNPIEYILVVEGYMDVIALAQHGVPNAVATLGTATSIYHIQLLAKYTKQLIFCFDGDLAGREAAWRALESSLPYLNQGLDASFMFLEQGQDPDSMIRTQGQARFLQAMKDALPLNRFLFDTLTKDINLQSASGKTQLINNIKPHLQKMNESSYKQLIINDLARLTLIDTHRLNILLSDPSSVATQNTQTKIKRTPVRIAMALLLQNPELYSKSKQYINLDLLNNKEHLLLKNLIQQLELNSEVNTALLIESFRDTAHFESLNKLAAWDHQVPEAELVKELMDTLLFLQKKNQELLINQLIDKSRHTGLEENEKIKLQKMLKIRHINLNPEK